MILSDIRIIVKYLEIPSANPEFRDLVKVRKQCSILYMEDCTHEIIKSRTKLRYKYAINFNQTGILTCIKIW